ncbi:MAG: transketolase C-terminal domain-containing protein [Bdellovibrionota bacterium]
MSQVKFTDAISRVLFDAMTRDEKTLLFGLGVADPKRVFGTTNGLLEAFGPERVFDTPTSENGMTGIAIGAATMGYRPVMVHQRLDFFLLAMDQLVNNAAKWHYMFGGQGNVPLTLRLLLGRGWGQGPTHSQNLQSWFAHVPGLRVVMPSTVENAYGLLWSSIFDPNPVVFLEHRWLHNQEGRLPEPGTAVPIGKAAIMREGSDVTLVSMSYMVLEALKAAEFLKSFGISAEVVDLRTIAPLDWQTVTASVRKTGRMIAIDTSTAEFSVTSEILAHVAQNHFSSLKAAPIKMGSPHAPVPTSVGLSEGFYPGAAEIAAASFKVLGISKVPNLESLRPERHDVPGAWFTGPF